MIRISLFFLILIFVHGLIFHSFSQNELKSLDSLLNNKENIIASVKEDLDSKNIVSVVSFLGRINFESNDYLGKFNLPSDEQINIIKTRGINNVSEMYKENSKSIVLLITSDYSSMGAGCIVTADGYILTNYHVIAKNNKMLTFLYDKNITKIEDMDPENFKIADVIAAIPEKDLAILKLSTSQKLKNLRLGNNSEIEVGQDVFAIGHPESFIWTFTDGVISQLRNNYEWSYDGRNKCSGNVIQTQTPINPGNSGGPLFNTNGDLIGINSFRTEGAEGLNFAIRVDELNKFLEEVKEGKHKYNVVVKKDKGSDEILWDRIDSNRNGIYDCEAADVDGNKIYDIVKVDENEDGFVDYIVVDSNQDNVIDIYIYDKNRDGHFEYFIMDRNTDGYLDTIGIDTNGDGVPNEFRKYKG